MQTTIALEHVKRRFRRTLAVNDVSFSVEHGELFGLVGPDGSGKTTLLRMMAGVLDASEGKITVAGHSLPRAAEAIKAQCGYMAQQFGLYGDLSVAENLQFMADVFDLPLQQRVQRLPKLYEFAQLADFKNRRARNLSGGMKKKLALACCLIHEPEILLLDEPTTGVDPVARRGFWDMLSQLHAGGTTTVVSTPYMDEAELCNRVALLFNGQLLACDTPQNIKAQVPGQVWALTTADNRQAKSLLQHLPGVLDIQPYGNRLNVIGDAATRQAIQDRLAGQVVIQRLDSAPLRMEEAFVYLVTQARKERAA